MNHDNRGRLAVDLGGAWRLYATTLPAGARALGTITKDGATGALILTASGILARLNAGSIVSLPQAKVQAALDAARAGSAGGAGRGQGARAEDGATNVRRVNITIDDAHDDIARQLGGGDRSLGIRRALAHASRSGYRP
jgi:hypothetical protein